VCKDVHGSIILANIEVGSTLEKYHVAWFTIPFEYDRRRMELRHLRYFVAVAEELNITRAAARLNVSQPPLSRQIRDLEEELGVVLLERSPKEVRLTPAGKVFFKEARAILRHAAEAIRKVRTIPRSGRVRLRVGYAPSPTVDILPRALRLFQRTATGANVELFDQSTEESIAGLSTGRIDVALVVRPPLKQRSGLLFEKLVGLPIGIIVPHAHPFARERVVTLEQALRERVVPYVRKSYADYHLWLSAMVKRARAKPRFATAVDGAVSLIAAVESGQGIGFAPTTFMRVAGRRVKFVELSPAAPSLDLGYLVRRGKRNDTLEKFLEALRSISSDAGHRT
jgi:DNA-binding transcriptional LysR family regulator